MSKREKVKVKPTAGERIAEAWVCVPPNSRSKLAKEIDLAITRAVSKERAKFCAIMVSVAGGVEAVSQSPLGKMVKARAVTVGNERKK